MRRALAVMIFVYVMLSIAAYGLNRQIRGSMPEHTSGAGTLRISQTSDVTETRTAGMWLCASPLIAYNFWNDLGTIQKLGIQVDSAIAEQVAKHEPCTRANSDQLKPTGAGWGDTLAFEAGAVRGWATSSYYVMYTKHQGSDFVANPEKRVETKHLPNGMWLCPSVQGAAVFWGDVRKARELGLETSYSTVAQVAKKSACSRVNSGALRPINSHLGTWGDSILLLTDGKNSGWAEAEYYVGYEGRNNTTQQ